MMQHNKDISIEIPWMRTEEYLEKLYSDPKFIIIDEAEVANTTYYKVAFLENLKLYQIENNLPCSQNVHCFRLKKQEATKKYYQHLVTITDDVYLFFEENSRYTHSNSPRLFMEEKLRQGLEGKDIEEKGVKYKEYLMLLDELIFGDKVTHRNSNESSISHSGRQTDENV